MAFNIDKAREHYSDEAIEQYLRRRGGEDTVRSIVNDPDIDEQSKKNITQKVGSFLGFVGKDIAYGAPKSESQGFLRRITQSTIGSRGLAGVAQEPGRVAGQPALLRSIEETSESQRELSNMNLRLIREMRSLPEDNERKDKLQRIIQDNMNRLGELNETAQMLQERVETPGQAIGRAGSAATTVASFGVPVAGSVAGRAGQAAIAGAGQGASQSLIEEEPAEDVVVNALLSGALSAGTSVGIDVGRWGLKAAGRFIGNTVKRTGAMLSGTTDETIETAFKRPDVAQKGLQQGPKIREELADTIHNTVKEYERQTRDDYARGLQKIAEEAGEQADDLSTEGVGESFLQQIDNFGVKVGKKKQLDFTNSTLGPTEQRTLQRVYDVIRNWDDTSPKGINDLAIRIGQAMKSGDDYVALNGILARTKKATRDYLGDTIPATKSLNRVYGKRMDLAQAVKNEMSVKGAFGNRSSAIKTTRKLGTLFNRNKDATRSLIKDLEAETGKEILGKEAGAQFMTSSRTTSTIGNLINKATQALGIDEAIGYGAMGAGKSYQWGVQNIAQPLQKVGEALSEIPPNKRAILWEIIGSEIE